MGVGGAILPLGHLDDPRDFHDFQVTLAAQQVTIDAGLFVLERELRFTFVEHFDTVDSLLTYAAEHAQKTLIPAELVARAHELLPPGTAGEVRVVSQNYAARLRRAGGGMRRRSGGPRWLRAG